MRTEFSGGYGNNKSKKNIAVKTMYKNNCSILGLTKGRCKFTTSDFPAENPRTQTRNYSYTNRCV